MFWMVIFIHTVKSYNSYMDKYMNKCIWVGTGQLSFSWLKLTRKIHNIIHTITPIIQAIPKLKRKQIKIFFINNHFGSLQIEYIGTIHAMLHHSLPSWLSCMSEHKRCLKIKGLSPIPSLDLWIIRHFLYLVGYNIVNFKIYLACNRGGLPPFIDTLGT